MRTTKGECKINGLHITEVAIKNLSPLNAGIIDSEIDPNKPPTGAVMEAVYATLEATDERALGNGRFARVVTHGRCTAVPSNWSLRTLQLLAELLDSMETDIMPRHFQESAAVEDEDARLEPGADEEVGQV